MRARSRRGRGPLRLWLLPWGSGTTTPRHDDTGWTSGSSTSQDPPPRPLPGPRLRRRASRGPPRSPRPRPREPTASARIAQAIRRGSPYLEVETSALVHEVLVALRHARV
ncbi:hypothetical protein [Nonomuraea dietziae]|uniref:hypothetical protein n=1 Tax=Nonomuraea dietziae TaxID=65515 RepID=UPI0031D3AA65